MTSYSFVAHKMSVVQNQHIGTNRLHFRFDFCFCQQCPRCRQVAATAVTAGVSSRDGSGETVRGLETILHQMVLLLLLHLLYSNHFYCYKYFYGWGETVSGLEEGRPLIKTEPPTNGDVPH